MQRIKDLRAEKKQNNLFQTVIWKNMLYNRKETILLIICETLIVAIAYSGSMCYQILRRSILVRYCFYRRTESAVNLSMRECCYYFVLSF